MSLILVREQRFKRIIYYHSEFNSDKRTAFYKNHLLLSLLDCDRTGIYVVSRCVCAISVQPWNIYHVGSVKGLKVLRRCRSPPGDLNCVDWTVMWGAGWKSRRRWIVSGALRSVILLLFLCWGSFVQVGVGFQSKLIVIIMLPLLFDLGITGGREGMAKTNMSGAYACSRVHVYRQRQTDRETDRQTDRT